MHMADALISPAVGGVMAAASASLVGYSIKTERLGADSRKVPMMGVMGAFVFGAQMINFAIPATGSSGHIGGGLLLAALLGSCGGFLALASVLIIQALFFADGGLLALGCNIFNMGFYTCFIAYPLIYRRVTLKKDGSVKPPAIRRIWIGSIAASIVGLQLGAFSVVLQTLLSGKTELPFGAFALLMQPVHLAIGIIEGMITAAILTFIFSARPELLNADAPARQKTRVLAIMMAAALLLGCAVSLFASSRPDGLEYSIESLEAEPRGESFLHEAAGRAQERMSPLPDYTYRSDAEGESARGKALSGLVGAVLTLCLTGAVAFICVLARKRRGHT